MTAVASSPGSALVGTRIDCAALDVPLGMQVRC